MITRGVTPKIDKRYYLDRLSSCIDGMFESCTPDTKDSIAEADLETKGIVTDSSLCFSTTPVTDILKKLKEGKITIEKLEELNNTRKDSLGKRASDKDKSAMIVNSLILGSERKSSEEEEGDVDE
jgi:hypothetical protein